MEGFKLREGMKLGVATAATQIEGGDTNNSWYEWYQRGKIKDGSSPVRANDHFAKYREDTALLKEMGIQIYRFGVEWSRIEPRNGEFDRKALEHYRDELKLLKEAGIEPLVTLHHFTNPLWIEHMGSFENPEVVKYFLRFAEHVVKAFGELSSEYITINEPNVYATNGFFFGDWPPGKKAFSSVQKVYNNLVVSHIKAYEMIHKIRSDMGLAGTKVSFANHLRVFEPKNALNPYHMLCTYLLDLFFQRAITKAMMTGQATFPIPRPSGINPGKYYDFIGINYYSRTTVSRFGDGVRENVPVNDLGWEIYPEGIIECIKWMYEAYRAPVYITENGTCDNNDTFRSRYIYDHLKAICESNYPVERYYHWCFLDNFEWLEGESARFGIVHVDYETQVRTIKESGNFFSEIIQHQGINKEIIDKYCVQHYNIK